MNNKVFENVSQDWEIHLDPLKDDIKVCRNTSLRKGNTSKQKEQPGCPICSRPLEDEQEVCSFCEIDLFVESSAEIYLYPTGKKLTKEQVFALTKVKK